MWIKKCDTCKKEIDEHGKTVRIGYSTMTMDNKEFCFSCGKKLLSKAGQKRFLDSKK